MDLTLEEIRRLKTAIADAQDTLERYIERRWPVGSPVTWDKHGHLQYGEVIHTGLSRLKVRNGATQRAYWIDIYDVELALEQRKVA